MPMKGQRVIISTAAALKRINRKLAREGEMLRRIAAARTASAMARGSGST